MKEFGETLKDLRMSKQLSFKELEKETGISSSSLCRWENFQSDITASQLIILAKYFKVSTDYLLGLED